MTTDVRRERTALCDLLNQVGPDQPTLCEGWLTRDLAAHLVLRERRPLAAPGIAVRPLSGYTARVQRRLADRPFPELIDVLRDPPGWSPARLAAVDRAINTLELFLHHEDIRRAQPNWQPRALADSFAAALWSRVRVIAKLRLRRFPAAVLIEAPGHGNQPTGRGGPQVRVTGDPGELALFCSGRQRVARVALSGPDELTGKLAAARLGF